MTASRVAYLVPNAAHVLLWHGTDLVPVGPSRRRFWPDRAELIAELARYGLHVDRHGNVTADAA